MQRRTCLQSGLGAVVAAPLIAAVRQDKLDAAAGILTKAAAEGQVHAAALYVRQGHRVFAKSFGASKSEDDIFLLASISKPISVAALMTLPDRGASPHPRKLVSDRVAEARAWPKRFDNIDREI